MANATRVPRCEICDVIYLCDVANKCDSVSNMTYVTHAIGYSRLEILKVDLHFAKASNV